MKRSLAVTAAVLLTVLTSGCSDSDEPDDAPSASGSPSGSPSSSASGSAPEGSSEGGSTEGGAGEVENETYPRGADVAAFCDVLAEIDGAIDGAQPGSEEDWERILSAFEGLDALGVPDNLPESAVSELVHVELLVQASGSVEEFTSAVQDSPPPSNTVDGYIDDNC